MKREILFRGKRVDNGEWVYGCYVIDPKGQHRIYWKPFEDATSNTYHFVNPDTIGQFTVITTKDTTKIFEHDIVKSDKGTGVVMFQNGCFILQQHERHYLLGDLRQVKIIGNIHDNPELLKEAQS
jgi:hypothetical protein